jgi:sugar diacid utilization regulator
MHEESAVALRRAGRREVRDSGDALLIFAEALARIAAGGGGAQALAAHLASVIDAAILVEDAEWRHIALAGTGERSVPASVRDLIPKAGADAQDGVPLGGTAASGARAYPIRAGEAQLGWLSIFPVGTNLAERHGLIRLTTASIAVELSREAGGSKGRRRSFWDRLLARAYDDPGEARADATARGIVLAPSYVAVSVEAEGLDDVSAAQKNAEIRRVCLDTLGTRSGDIVVVERGGGFFFLVPTPHEVDAQNARTAATLIPRGITRAGLDVKVVGGVGCHAEMLHVASSVDEAHEATTIARKMFGGGVMPHDALGVYPLLYRGGGTREEWKAFAQTVLGPLLTYDEKHQTELMRTLRLFFDVGQNIKVAAASLNVHRHTVFYRLRQIAEIGNLDLDSPHDQLTLRTAIAINALGS